ncbi:2-oxoglutarate receptor 1 [Esox lucius]|uniref:G-protein coupled receptors family 1 profile domain-containing protein n=1 Tax=Esox lucius TaxID=8010 RepID=A0AAY5KEE9_ESOLU|nr:2-oxoglutarate receptor 1 [Esox lucius]
MTCIATHSTVMSSIISYGNESSQNCTNVALLTKHYYLPVIYSVICLVGILGNIVAITIYLAKLRPWKSSEVIMVNLALTDLLYVLSLPFLVYYYANSDSWTLGNFMCRFVRFGFHLNLYGSILFLTCLAVFRYVVVMHPLRAPEVQRKRWGFVACAAVWAIAVVEIWPLLTILNLVEKNNTTQCLDFASSDPVELLWWYSWLLTVVNFLLPLVVVVVCYVCIRRKLATGPHNPGKIRARRLTVLVLVVFVACFLPYHVLRALRIAVRMNPHSPCMLENWVHAVYIMSRPMTGLNTFFNLALYTMGGEKFQQAALCVFPGGHCWARAGTHSNRTSTAIRGSNTTSIEEIATTETDTNQREI